MVLHNDNSNLVGVREAKIWDKMNQKSCACSVHIGIKIKTVVGHLAVRYLDRDTMFDAFTSRYNSFHIFRQFLISLNWTGGHFLDVFNEMDTQLLSWLSLYLYNIMTDQIMWVPTEFHIV